MLKFRNAPAPDICAARVRMASRDFGPRQVVLVCLRLRAPPDGGIVRRLAQLPFLIERDFSVLQAPSILLTVDARFALDQQWTARGQFVR